MNISGDASPSAVVRMCRHYYFDYFLVCSGDATPGVQLRLCRHYFFNY